MNWVCEVAGCGRGPDSTGHTLHRVSPVGAGFVGRCYQHLTPEQREEVDPIIRVLEKGPQP